MKKELTCAEYQDRAMETCMPSCENVAYMLNNLIGEVGEVCEKIVQNIEHKLPENIIVQHLKIFVQISKFYGMTSKKIRKQTDDALKFCADDLQAAMLSLTDSNLDEINKELGDILWQLSGMCSVLGYDLEDVAITNLEKLASRKERGKIDGDGDNR